MDRREFVIKSGKGLLGLIVGCSANQDSDRVLPASTTPRRRKSPLQAETSAPSQLEQAILNVDLPSVDLTTVTYPNVDDPSFNSIIRIFSQSFHKYARNVAPRARTTNEAQHVFNPALENAIQRATAHSSTLQHVAVENVRAGDSSTRAIMQSYANQHGLHFAVSYVPNRRGVLIPTVQLTEVVQAEQPLHIETKDYGTHETNVVLLGRHRLVPFNATDYVSVQDNTIYVTLQAIDKALSRIYDILTDAIPPKHDPNGVAQHYKTLLEHDFGMAVQASGSKDEFIKGSREIVFANAIYEGAMRIAYKRSTANPTQHGEDSVAYFATLATSSNPMNVAVNLFNSPQKRAARTFMDSGETYLKQQGMLTNKGNFVDAAKFAHVDSHAMNNIGKHLFKNI